MNTLLTKILTYSENDLCKFVLVPLFLAMGYERVEFSGGPLDGGIDILGWRKGEANEVLLMVSQVKKAIPRKATTGKGTFSEILNQLAAASERRLPYSDGKEYSPQIVYFITPYPISTFTINSRLAFVKELEIKRIRILDGPSICSLLTEKAPHVAAALDEGKSQLQQVISSHLTNEMLLQVLQLKQGRRVETFYTDVDFLAGRPSLQRLFGGVSGKKQTINIDLNQWSEFENLCRHINELLGCSLLVDSIDEINNTARRRICELEKWTKKHDQVENDYKHAQTEANRLSERFERREHAFGMHSRGQCLLKPTNIINPKEFWAGLLLHSKEHKALAKVKKCFSNNTRRLIRASSIYNCGDLAQALALDLNRLITYGNIWADFRDETELLPLRINALAAKNPKGLLRSHLNRDLLEFVLRDFISDKREPLNGLKMLRRALKAARKEYATAQRKYERGLEKHEISLRKRPKNLSVPLNSVEFASSINRYCMRIIALVRKINESRDEQILPDLLKRLSALEEVIRKTENWSKLTNILEYAERKNKMEEWAETRVNVPLREVFKTGRNCVVLGSAGAGKTTALQKYAQELLADSNCDRIVLFVPLAKLITNTDGQLYDGQSKGSRLESQKAKQTLDKLIVNYLRSLGINWSLEDFASLLSRKGGVFLLDGIDEVYHKAPWVGELLSSYTRYYAKVQVISSSRITSPRYIREVSFSSVLILPFTNTQRAEFVKKWFSSEDESKADVVLKHILENKEIAEIVRIPLLTTILCVLASFGLRLPNTEVRLYDERLKLLTGRYDRVRNVNRLSTMTVHLETLSRKLAFHMHMRKIKAIGMDEASEVARTVLGQEIGIDQSMVALNELIDPCNILLTADFQGALTFDHLRFQEHLAARELALNRGISIESLINSPWWKDVFILYAEMNQDLFPVIRELQFSGKMSTAMETIAEMAKVCGRKDAELLKNLIAKTVNEHTWRSDSGQIPHSQLQDVDWSHD